MAQVDSTAYPGADLTALQLLQLAEQYESAARKLCCTEDKIPWPQQSPFRLLTTHAIELYLSACLRAQGMSAESVRAMQHRLDQRLDAIGPTLPLRAATLDHLKKMTVGRDYLRSRYDLAWREAAPPNRFLASLTDVARKVHKLVDRSNTKPVPLSFAA